MSTYEDPGWGPAIRRGPFIVLLPFAHIRTMYTLRKGGVDGLTVLRMLFLHFLFALLLFLVVLVLVLGEEEPKPIPGWMAVAFPVVLVGCLAGVAWARARPLVVSDETSLAGSYRTVFFLGVAYAEAAALFGFVGVFLVDRLTPYLIGLGVAVVGLTLIAPTRANIERRQREITAQGSTLSLGRTLVDAPGR